MNLFEVLKNLKNIEADKGFTARSRSMVLRGGREPVTSIFSVVFRGLEVGASLALAGLLIFAMLGGLAAWDVLAPVDVTALDPDGLRAEAEAIDIQIELMGLNYKESLKKQPQSEKESTSAFTGGALNLENETTTPAFANINEAPEALSLDEALQLLSE